LLKGGHFPKLASSGTMKNKVYTSNSENK